MASQEFDDLIWTKFPLLGPFLRPSVRLSLCPSVHSSLTPSLPQSQLPSLQLPFASTNLFPVTREEFIVAPKISPSILLLAPSMTSCISNTLCIESHMRIIFKEIGKGGFVEGYHVSKFLCMLLLVICWLLVNEVIQVQASGRPNKITIIMTIFDLIITILGSACPKTLEKFNLEIGNSANRRWLKDKFAIIKSVNRLRGHAVLLISHILQ